MPQLYLANIAARVKSSADKPYSEKILLGHFVDGVRSTHGDRFQGGADVVAYLYPGYSARAGRIITKRTSLSTHEMQTPTKVFAHHLRNSAK